MDVLRFLAADLPFLALSLAMGIVAMAVVFLRRDLWRMLVFSAVFALPFALTEPLFYPEYWSPPFLFDLGSRFGVGIEDALFVVALAVISAGLFPVVTGTRVLPFEGFAARVAWRRGGVILAGVGIATAGSVWAGFPPIYVAPVLMAAVLALILRWRPDLLGPAVGGGLLTGLLYGVILGWVDRMGHGVIERYWHADRFLARTWSGLPAEEWLYGFGAGALGAVFYGYVTGTRIGFHGSVRRITVGAWIRSMRLPAQSYIFFPLLLGQLVAVRQAGGALDMDRAAWVHLYGIFIHLFIVWANDYADEGVDQLNRTYTLFSGGSRVLPDGLLKPRHLRSAARWALAAGGLSGLGLAVLHGRHLVPLLVLASWGLLWAYSYRPIRASYRGFGEALQAVGVGLVLPLLGFHAQGGSISSFPAWIPVVVLPTQLACAVSTSLPDAPSDRLGGKRTLSVRLGATRGFAVVVVLHAVSLFGLVTVAGLARPARLAVPAFAALLFILAQSGKRAAPGTPGMSRTVALSIGITVLLMAYLAAFAVP